MKRSTEVYVNGKLNRRYDTLFYTQDDVGLSIHILGICILFMSFLFLINRFVYSNSNYYVDFEYILNSLNKFAVIDVSWISNMSIDLPTWAKGFVAPIQIVLYISIGILNCFVYLGQLLGIFFGLY